MDTAADERQRTVERLHVVTGLLIALDHWDELSRLVGAARDREAAAAALRGSPFEFSAVQVEHALDLPLGRHTSAARALLEDEAAELRRVLGQ